VSSSGARRGAGGGEAAAAGGAGRADARAGGSRPGRPGASPRPDTDRCPRCGGAFHCGVADPAPCACTTLRLDAATLARLKERHGLRCLCLRCLAEVAAGASV
jgi:hypothetical protein